MRFLQRFSFEWHPSRWQVNRAPGSYHPGSPSVLHSTENRYGDPGSGFVMQTKDRMQMTMEVTSSDHASAVESVSQPAHAGISKLEVAIGLVLFALMLALRWRYITAHPWNSDEPQHLHIVWAWASGLLPYRDVFDNHSPLFSWLFSALFRCFSERADIVEPMRFAMWPLFALSLWCVYRIGALLYSPRHGLWAAVISGFVPPWFAKMGEFRTDVLWTTLWLVTLLILLTGRMSRRRLFFAGLAMGATFSVSMKSTLLIITVLVAAGIAWVIARRFAPTSSQQHSSKSGMLADAGAALGGLIVVPSLFIAFFAAHGALGPFYYCIIQHNIMPGSHTPWHFIRQFLSPTTLVAIPALLAGATALPLFATDPERAYRRLFVLLTAGLFYPILNALWTMITPQDYMPVFPLAGIVIAPPLLWLSGRFGDVRGLKFLAMGLPLLLVAGELGWLVKGRPLSVQPNRDEINRIATVLTLSAPGEFVMDSKGESIYRPRPYYYVLETLTRKRLLKKMMPDELPQRLIETRTAVMCPTGRMTDASQQFVAANYIAVGRVSVLGKLLTQESSSPGTFNIDISARYTLLGKNGEVRGSLDSTQWAGPRFLEAGPHEFKGTADSGPIALVWATAVEKGFSPFPKPKSK